MRLARAEHRTAVARGAAASPTTARPPMRLATRPRGLAALASGAAAVAVGLAAGGCDIKSFIDPTEMFPNVKTPLQKPVLTSLSALDPSIDDPTDEFYNAQEIQPQDNLVVSRDYRIGKGDLINVSVSNLVEQNLETVRQSTVSESGNINLPLIATPVKAEGLTESELQRAVSDAYRNANILSNAQVSVQVLEARARSFNVLGAVQAPGQYIIFKADFRVLDALVLAHDVLQSVDTIYVIRQVKEDPNTMPPEAPSSPGGGGGPAVVPTPPGVDPLAPRGDAGPAPGGVMTLMQTPATDATAATTAPVAPALTPATPTPAAPAAAAPAPAGPPAAAAAAPTPAPSAIPPSPEAVPAPAAPVPAPAFQFAAPQAPSATRTIRVPLTALRSGALEYNIVIRPGDLIMVPQPVVGEYYMGGHVLRVGVYSLSARKITIKQAIISAGMLDGVGIPQRTEIYRRIGAAREALVRVDVDAIFSGDQPDIYLKPNDVVMTGTNLLAPFIAAVRQGFRITYGFGFLYDRNFAPAQQGT